MFSRLSVRWLHIITLIIVSFTFCSLSHSKTIDLKLIVSHLNQLREEIKSGELRLILTREFKAKGSAEEIEQRINHQIRSEQEKARFQGLPEIVLQRIEEESKAWGTKFNAHTTKHEISIAFQIDDIGTVQLTDYKYRQLVRTIQAAIEDEFETFKEYDELIFYDGNFQAQGTEGPGELYLGLFETDKAFPTFSHNYPLFGRSQYRISMDMVQSVDQVTIDTNEYYVLTLANNGNHTVFREDRTHKLWIDSIHYWVVKEEVYSTSSKAKLYTIAYTNFRELSDGIWFPTVATWKQTPASKLSIRTLVLEVKEADFNLDFPPNFFEINLEEIDDFIRQGFITFHRGSDISLGQEELPQLQADADLPVDVECGPKSLFAVLQLLNIEATYDEILSLCSVNPQHGVSLLSIFNAAKAKGLIPTGLRMNLQQLKKSTFPSIAHFRHGHFLVVLGVDRGGIKITDPSGFYDSPMAIEEFEKLWDGYILTLQKQKESYIPSSKKQKIIESRSAFLPQPAASAQQSTPLHFKETEHDFGTAIGKDQIRHRFEFVNQSSNIVTIEGIDTSCHCTAATLLNKEISPGKKGFIEVTLDVPNGNGPVNESVYVRTSEPQSDKVELKFVGRAKVPVIAEPSHIIVGKRRFSQEREFTTELKIPDFKDVEEIQIMDIVTSSSYIEIRSELLHPSMAKGNKTLKVVLLPGLTAGNIRDSIEVRYMYKSRELNLHIPIVGEIIGDFLVSPERLFYGLIKSDGQVTRTFKILGTGVLVERF